jgi:hypothetical protein
VNLGEDNEKHFNLRSFSYNVNQIQIIYFVLQNVIIELILTLQFLYILGPKKSDTFIINVDKESRPPSSK